MQGRKKGTPKTGGKPKGYTDETKKRASELFVNILESKIDKVDSALEELYHTDKDKFLNVFAKFAQYFVAKKVESTGTITMIAPQIVVKKKND